MRKVRTGDGAYVYARVAAQPTRLPVIPLQSCTPVVPLAPISPQVPVAAYDMWGAPIDGRRRRVHGLSVSAHLSYCKE
jgi:hypothetical protein